MDEAVLKLSICANFAHGSFLSGDKQLKRRECLYDYLTTVADAAWFENLSSELGLEEEGAHTMSVEEIMESSAMRRRGKFEPCLQC